MKILDDVLSMVRNARDRYMITHGKSFIPWIDKEFDDEDRKNATNKLDNIVYTFKIIRDAMIGSGEYSSNYDSKFNLILQHDTKLLNMYGLKEFA